MDQAPPASEAAARDLVARMVDNGLSAEPTALEQIVAYLARTYGKAQTDATSGQPSVTAVQKAEVALEEPPRDDRGGGGRRGQ